MSITATQTYQQCIQEQHYAATNHSLWQLARKSSQYALPVIAAVGALIAFAFLAANSLFIPIIVLSGLAAVTFCCFRNIYLNLVKYCENKETEALAFKECLGKVDREEEALSAQSPEQLRDLAIHYQIPAARFNQMDQLIPLMAHTKFWTDEAQALEAQSTVNYWDSKLVNRALDAKIKAAF